MNPRFSSEGFPQGASSTAGLTGHPVTWMFQLPAMGRVILWLLALQSCRPYSGAVIFARSRRWWPSTTLQLCRPYYGAVIWTAAVAHKATAECFNRAAPIPGRLSGAMATGGKRGDATSIVPPLFRGGYDDAVLVRMRLVLASIVPPLFRGGYAENFVLSDARVLRFNCAAPIPGRLSWLPRRIQIRFRRFNCAAPIPGRLSLPSRLPE